jgi:hypothetical protein
MKGYYCCQLIREKGGEKGEKGLTGAPARGMTGTRRNCVANLNKALTCAITNGRLQARYRAVSATRNGRPVSVTGRSRRPARDGERDTAGPADHRVCTVGDHARRSTGRLRPPGRDHCGAA